MTTGFHLELQFARGDAPRDLGRLARICAQPAHGAANDEPREQDRQQRANRQQHEAVALRLFITLFGVVQVQVGSRELHPDQLLEVARSIGQRRSQRVVAPGGEVGNLFVLQPLEEFVDRTVGRIEHRGGLVGQRLLVRNHLAEEVAIPVIVRLVDGFLDQVMRFLGGLLLFHDVERSFERQCQRVGHTLDRLAGHHAIVDGVLESPLRRAHLLHRVSHQACRDDE